MARPRVQPSFSDVRLEPDEELEQQLRTILDNQPTPDDIARGQRRRAANKRTKDILLNRHKTDCVEAGENGDWLRIGDLALIKPAVNEIQAGTKMVNINGRTTMSLQVQPAAWQLQFMNGDGDATGAFVT